MSYSVKAVCQLTGLSRSTLLSWERRYGVVQPERHANGYRSYSEMDLRRLRRLIALIESGLRVGDAVEVVARERIPAPVELNAQLISALLELDTQKARDLREWYEHVDVTQQVDRIFAPLTTDLRERAANGELTIVQQRYAHSWLRRELLALLGGVLDHGIERPMAAVLTPVGERDDLALLAQAVRVGAAGWNIDWLGTEFPVTALRPYVSARRPDMVLVAIDPAEGRERTEDVVREMRACVPTFVPIVAASPDPESETHDVRGITWATTVDDMERLLPKIEERAHA